MPQQKSTRQPIIPIGPSIAYIPLTKGQFARIDVGDVPLVEGFNWLAFWSNKTKTYYAARSYRVRTEVWRTMLMHRVILTAPGGLLVDHRNGDTLNNQRSNLRLATSSQNAANRNRATFKNPGVKKRKGCERWYAQIGVNSKTVYLGSFASEDEAISARDKAAQNIYGEFIRTA